MFANLPQLRHGSDAPPRWLLLQSSSPPVATPTPLLLRITSSRPQRPLPRPQRVPLPRCPPLPLRDLRPHQNQADEHPRHLAAPHRANRAPPSTSAATRSPPPEPASPRASATATARSPASTASPLRPLRTDSPRPASPIAIPSKTFPSGQSLLTFAPPFPPWPKPPPKPRPIPSLSPAPSPAGPYPTNPGPLSKRIPVRERK